MEDLLIDTIKKLRSLERVDLEKARYLQKIEAALDEIHGHWEYESKEIFKPSFASDGVLMVGPYEGRPSKRLWISYTIGTVVKTLPISDLYLLWQYEIIDDYLPKFLKELDDHLKDAIIAIGKKRKG